MDDPNNPVESDIVGDFKKRLLEKVVTRMEGTFNHDSVADMQMFDDLFADLLDEESLVLSRAERKRLRDELLSSI